jgi:hypothetical protein
MSIKVVDTAESARSTRDSILSLYGHLSYYEKILDPREGAFAMALEMQTDHSRASTIIESHLDQSSLTSIAGAPVIHEDDSDEDDEHKRSTMASPIVHTTNEILVRESKLSSARYTPPKLRHDSDLSKLLDGIAITKWTASQCADYISGLGLPQYSECFSSKLDHYAILHWRPS